MDKYAHVDPSDVPANTAVVQLPPVDVNGINYYGVEFLPTKIVDTGKKDKQTKQEIKGVQLDTSKKPGYDLITSLIKAGKLNDPSDRGMIAKLLMGSALMKGKIAELEEEVKAIKQQMGGTK